MGIAKTVTTLWEDGKLSVTRRDDGTFDCLLYDTDYTREGVERAHALLGRVLDDTAPVGPLMRGNDGTCRVCTCTARHTGPCGSPMATPAPYVPKVGDVVETIPGNPSYVATVVSIPPGENDLTVHYHDLPPRDLRCSGRRLFYVRRATPAERLAAGLPVEPKADPLAALRRIVTVLGPKAPECCEGCAVEMGEALKVAREAIDAVTPW